MTKILTDIQIKNYKTLIMLLGLVFFCFSIAAALTFQKLILPQMTSMLASGSSLTVDSAYYDLIAAGMAEDVKLHGWSRWTFFPNNFTSGNVSILAALYVVFGHDPALAIPLNALFHALGGVLIFMIAVELSSNYLIGICSGIVASFIFVLFPSALNWYGQILKDGYSIAAVLAVLLVWIKGMNTPANTLKSFYLVFLGTLALIFLITIRPYFFKLCLLLVFLVLIAMLIWRVVSKEKNSWAFFLYIILTFVPTQMFLSSSGGLTAIRAGEGYAGWDAGVVSPYKEIIYTDKDQRLLNEISVWKWQPSNFLPIALDNQLATVAKTRVGLIDFGVRVGANSLIDADEIPRNVVEIATYLPRAFQIALLAPFPTSWFDQLSVTRVLAIAEMIVIYICLFGLIPLLSLNRSSSVIFTFCFSAFFLIVYGFITANVGTLYRVRYAFELLMVLLGVMGWVSYFDKRGMLQRWVSKLKKNKPALSFIVSNPSKKKVEMNRKSVIGAGVVVSILTAVGFVGFFFRDVLMAHKFDFGKELDEFFLALLIPMFVVTVFCAPLGAAFVPFFKRAIERVPQLNLRELISHLVAMILLVMFFVSIGIYLFSPQIFESLHVVGKGVAVPENLSTLLILALIILMFSGVVILGNSVLMVKEQLIIPSAVQVVVPVVAILSLFLFGSFYGVLSVMIGMVVGQLINLIVIQLYLRKYELSLIPRYRAAKNQELTELWKLYFPLLASAFFAGVMMPVDTMLASTLENGSVSIFNLGMKIVLFVSGLLGVVVSNVMLPYFSTIVEKSSLYMAKRELSFFMLVAILISTPASILFYIWSEQIVRLVFYSNGFVESDLMAVKSVMQYSVVQIPFFICNILLLKYATATRHLTAITFSAFVGLLLNIGLSLVLMPSMGVSGIALATSVAMIASSVLILLMLSFYGHISVVDVVLVSLNWMLFLTLVIALHFQSMPSIVMAVFSYGILLFAYAKLTSDSDSGGYFAVS